MIETFIEVKIRLRIYLNVEYQLFIEFSKKQDMRYDFKNKFIMYKTRIDNGAKVWSVVVVLVGNWNSQHTCGQFL